MSVTKLGMPKWGMSMSEGKLVAWLVEEGAELTQGMEVAEVETEKINGLVEAPAAGVLRRRIAQVGEELPVGALLGVIADASVPDAEIDAFVEEFQASFVPGAADEDEAGATSTVEAGGRTFRTTRMGSGDETVVLVHGFGGDLTTWLFTQAALAESRTAIALDLPGHGGSSKDVGDGSLATLAAALGEALDALEVERAHLVGHSLGGAVAIELARTQPARVASLVLIASAGLGPEINGEYVEGFLAAESRNQIKPVLQLLFADPAVVTRQLCEDVLKVKRIDGVQEALRAIADQVFPGGRQAIDLAGALAELDVPVLAIWGDADRIVPPAHAASLPARARVEVLPGAGHSPMMEAAGDVNRLIGDFLG